MLQDLISIWKELAILFIVYPAIFTAIIFILFKNRYFIKFMKYITK